MDDIGKIKEFVAHVYAWLGASYGSPGRRVDMPPWPKVNVDPELSAFAAAAWQEYEGDHPLANLQASVAMLPQDTLKSHGLYDKQLKYKLATIDLAARRAMRGLSGWLRKLLELIDNLLESILKALNVDDALKEMKDALLASLPDGE